MALEVVGSNPTTHPIFYNLREFLLGCRQEVKARDFDSRIVGSNPAASANSAHTSADFIRDVAQSGEGACFGNMMS